MPALGSQQVASSVLLGIFRTSVILEPHAHSLSSTRACPAWMVPPQAGQAREAYAAKASLAQLVVPAIRALNNRDLFSPDPPAWPAVPLLIALQRQPQPPQLSQ